MNDLALENADRFTLDYYYQDGELIETLQGRYYSWLDFDAGYWYYNDDELN